MAIHFHRPAGRHGFLSNFSAHPVDIAGERWNTAEHYYQAMKFPDDPERQRRIAEAERPMQAKRIAHEPDAELCADWSDRRVEVMREVLRCKFKQHWDLRARLLSTDDKVLVERSESDLFWGDGGDGSGQNMLGQLLMELRERLRGGKPPKGNKTKQSRRRSRRRDPDLAE